MSDKEEGKYIEFLRSEWVRYRSEGGSLSYEAYLEKLVVFSTFKGIGLEDQIENIKKQSLN